MRRLLTVAGAMACFGLLGVADANAQNQTNRAVNQDYVAMGDSYSSGNGTNDYYEADPCYRSNFSYGPLINPNIPGTFSHPACSGARTPHIDQTTQTDFNYPKQIDLLGANTDFVTLTIGGNDAGFTDALTNCAVPFGGCADSGGSLDQAQTFIQNSLPALLDRNYASIRSKAPNAVVTVIGYPRLFKTSGTCNLVFSEVELRKANATADLLNDVMRQRVQAAGPGFAYVDSRAAWIGHGACDSVEWINGFSASDTSGSFHPNKTGYVAFGGMAQSTLLAQRRTSQTIGPNGHIAFASTRDGNSEVYVANADGSFPVNVTNDAGADTEPVFSPDGTKIAFTSNRDGDNEIYTVNADGSGLTKLTNNTFNDGDPDWSPNGDLIAFRTNRDGNDEIYKMSSTGTSPTRLTTATQADQAPDWSPDGSEIAFQRVIGSTNTDVWRMSSDGQGQISLTGTVADYVDSQPAWSPNGNLIAFQSNRDGDAEIFTVARIAPVAVPAVTPPTPVQRTSNTFADREPAYSPDGTRLSFTSNRDGNDEIYTATVSGTGAYPGQSRITNTAAGDALPTWQGDQAAPDTSIAGPSGRINQATPTFTFDSTEPGSSFECRVDGGTFASCPTPFTTSTLGEGPHTIQARATDPSGNTDGTPASRAFTVDLTPATTAITSGPDNGAVTNDSSPAFEFASDDPDATFECKVDNDPYAPCSSPFTPAGLSDGQHTFTVRGTDSAGNPDAAPDTATFEIDATAPNTTIDASPPPSTNNSSPTFEFSSNETGATFECRINVSGTWSPCSSPFTSPQLADGSQTFEVRATDAADNTDPTPASVTFTIDTAAPDTSITSSAPPAGDNSPTFSFTSDDPNATFECRIDIGALVPCSSPFTSPQLADGDHTFEVQATDQAGNTDPTRASLDFSTDATAPGTAIDSGPGRNTPGEQTEDTTPRFTFSSDDPAATYECQVDSEPYIPCDQELTTEELSLGSHAFRVRATDAVGNVDQSPAEATFEVVDTTAPDTTITDGPTGRIADDTPTFGFTATESGSSFECRIDTDPFADCDSPFTVASLSDGQHTFDVRATDGAGNTDGTPDSRTFTVDTTAPATTITSGPSGRIADDSPTYEFNSDDPDADIECRIDTDPFADCDSPFTTEALADGQHTFEVRAVDDVGNTDPTPDSRTFTVDTTAPTTTITSGPTGPTAANTPAFEFTSDDPDAGFECRIDSATFGDCDSPFTSNGLSDGPHTFEVRAIDDVGNTDGTPASRTFTVDTATPDTQISTTVPARINDATPTFEFTSPDDNDADFECRVDTAAFAECDSPFTTNGLGDGSHTFEVRAVDGVGNTDATPASRTFIVDTAAPDTSITQGPSGITGDATPTFDFTSPDATADFECRVDTAAFADCTSPSTTTSLSDGPHTFEVRAVDEATNTDATPASRSFTVDTGPPETTIDAKPGALTNDATPTFTFSSGDAGATFACRVDGGAFTSCSSPLSTASLSDGDHTFEVRATDGADNTDATPASHTFTVDTAAPDTTITSGPSGPTRDRNVTFTQSSENGASLECRVDGGAFAPCGASETLRDLPDGDHTFEARATDAAGNADPTPAARSFRVDNAVEGATVTAKRKQKTKRGKVRIALQASAGETVEVTTTGKLKAGRKSISLAPAEITAQPGGPVTLTLVPADKAGARKAKKRLASGKKIKARITATVTDELGNQRTFALRVKLR